MAADRKMGQVELTNRILGIIEGESSEVLAEQLKLLEYHMGFNAKIFSGEEKLIEIIKK